MNLCPCKFASVARPEAKDLRVSGSELQTLCLGPLQPPDVAATLRGGRNWGSPALHWTPRRLDSSPSHPAAFPWVSDIQEGFREKQPERREFPSCPCSWWGKLGCIFSPPGDLPPSHPCKQRCHQWRWHLLRQERFAGKQDCGRHFRTCFIYWALSSGNRIL